jgi:hypothetical protein
MTCGLCGSAISADEKFKKLKNGETNRHVYYKCAKSKDHNCKNFPINETDLIKQFGKMIDGMKVNELKVQEKIKDEILRFKKFQKSLLNQSIDIRLEDIDVKNYVKFVLKDGSVEEKRDILENITGKIVFNNKKITLN